MSPLNPETATEAVERAAARLGITLPPGGARVLAAAALTHADSVLGIRRVAWREEWANEGYRANVRRRMQIQVLEELIAKEMLAVTLPAEKLAYRIAGQGPLSQPVPEEAPWDQVEITLRVQARDSRGVT